MNPVGLPISRPLKSCFQETIAAAQEIQTITPGALVSLKYAHCFHKPLAWLDLRKTGFTGRQFPQAFAAQELTKTMRIFQGN
jgi:hypothetical protein